MANKTIPVTVRIYGKEYPVACPAGEENGLLASAKRVDNEMRKIREAGKVVGTDRIAVLVALNLAYELLLSKETASDDAVDGQSLQRIKNLQDQLDASLSDYKDRWVD